MKKNFYKGLIVFLAIFVFITIVSCSFGNQTEKANEYIDKANEKIDSYNELDEDAEEIGGKYDVLEDTPEGHQEAIKLTDQLDKIVEDQKDELEEAKDNYKKISDLNVSDEFKKYVEMEIDVVDSLLELADKNSESVKGLKELFQKISEENSTESELKALNDKVFKLNQEAEDIADEADKLKDKALDYYKDNDLG